MPDSPNTEAEVESGDRRRALLAMRGLLARRLDTAANRDLAALTRRLMTVMEELEKLGTDDAQTIDDELAERRAAILSSTSLERTAKGS